MGTYFFQALKAELFSSLLELRGRWCDWECEDEGEECRDGDQEEGAHLDVGTIGGFV
jgi:hypothetical protein